MKNSTEYTLDNLAEGCAKAVKSVRRRQKEKYLLARKLGFSGTEAGVLQNRTEEIIYRLAKEREQSGDK